MAIGHDEYVAMVNHQAEVLARLRDKLQERATKLYVSFAKYNHERARFHLTYELDENNTIQYIIGKPNLQGGGRND